MLGAEPNWAEKLEAWATVVAAAAAIGAGVFAALAWRATKGSLTAAQDALRIEQDRRAEERYERLARARAVASRLVADFSAPHAVSDEPRFFIVNGSDVPFEDVKYEITTPRFPDAPIRLRLDSLGPGETHVCIYAVGGRSPDRSWSVRYSDGEGRRWLREERQDTYLAAVDDTPPGDLPPYRTVPVVESE